MAEYRISADLYKRIEERKSKMRMKIAIFVVIELIIVAVCVLSGRDGIVLGVVFEGLWLYFAWKYLYVDLLSLRNNDMKARIVDMKAERYVDRRATGGGRRGRGVAYKRYTMFKYMLFLKTEDERELTVILPTKDAYRSYSVGDDVLILEFMPYPIITSRTPKPAACPQCGHILHYEDGACHNCGLEDIYPELCNTPKWERG